MFIIVLLKYYWSESNSLKEPQSEKYGIRRFRKNTFSIRRNVFSNWKNREYTAYASRGSKRKPNEARGESWTRLQTNNHWTASEFKTQNANHHRGADRNTFSESNKFPREFLGSEGEHTEESIFICKNWKIHAIRIWLLQFCKTQNRQNARFSDFCLIISNNAAHVWPPLAAQNYLSSSLSVSRAFEQKIEYNASEAK